MRAIEHRSYQRHEIMDQQMSGEISEPVLATLTVETEDDANTLAQNSRSSIGCATGNNRLELKLNKRSVFSSL